MDDILMLCMFIGIIACYGIMLVICIIYELTPETISKKLVKRGILTKIDFEKTKDYYRDILYNHSITELSYIDDFELDFKKEIVSTLLSLENKKKIKIENEKIIVLDENDTDLKLTEKDVFHSIKNGNVEIEDNKKFAKTLQEHALQEGIENGLLCKVDSNKKTTKIFNIFIVFAFIAILGILLLLELFYTITFRFDNNEISLIAEYIYTIIFSMLVPVYTLFMAVGMDIFIYYRKNMLNAYERTDLGNSINEKIEGLKKYIEDYSLLDEKEKQELVLWDEYLIYSVQFKQNKKILKKMLKLIKDEYQLKKFVYITKKELILSLFILGVTAIPVLLFKDDEDMILGSLSLMIIIFALYYGANNKEK